MIRAIILWFARRLLSKYVSAAVAGQLVDAASAAYDEIKARGEEGVTVEGKGDKARLVIRPHDPGAIPVTIEDIYRGDPA